MIKVWQDCRGKGKRLASGVAAACLVFMVSQPVHAGSVGVYDGVGGPLRVRVTSLKEARFKTVIRQRYDFSCGSAALASLLTFHYGRPASEHEVFMAMYRAGDQERIRTAGFSLLDMKTYLKGLDIRSDGYRVTLDKLEKAGVPAITLINTKGYRHFVLVKGVRGDNVLIGDPAMGVRVYKRRDFEDMWEGIAFIIRDNLEVAQASFNRQKEWNVWVKAPVGTALSGQALASFTANLPSLGNF